MAKLIIGFVVGVCVTVVVGYVLGYFWIYPQVTNDAYSLGRFHEAVDIGTRFPVRSARTLIPTNEWNHFWAAKWSRSSS